MKPLYNGFFSLDILGKEIGTYFHPFKHTL